VILCAVVPALLLQSAAAEPSTLRHANGLLPPTVTAVRVNRPPSLDGRLNDPAWALAPPVTALIQRDPNEGKSVSESTVVRVVYDGSALYVGARLFDSAPGRIARRLARRDASTQSDEFWVLLDSYHDHRTAFRFTVNPAGVKRDLLMGDDGGFSDDSWDPVWETATAVDSRGWIVEMRIPFSQLRFSPAQRQVWGVRFVRRIQRKNELALFPFVAKTESGLASRFAHLVGLRDISAPKRLELLPYAVGRGAHHRPEVAGSPFDRGSSFFGGAGLDLKYGVSSNLTLDAAANPDFGQVQIDPAYVNLTEFEEFLEERRPFFIEGADIFDFGGNGGGLARFSGAPLWFYSRRIGRPPQGKAKGDFVDTPSGTTILGAAKLSGKTASSWSVGVLDAVTARERATVADATTGARHQNDVEPATNYFVGRLKRDFQGGSTSLGLLATSVKRDRGTPALNFLRHEAYAGGLDLLHRWSDNTYSLAANLGASYVRGDSVAIQRAQRASARYYQRPDARSFTYRPDRTSLAGLAGDLHLNKVAGNWKWSIAGSTSTPGFEINDLGFQRRVDRISAAAAAGRSWTRPGRVFREANALLKVGPSWNYDGVPIQRSVSAFAYGQFRNFWACDMNVSYQAAVLDDRLTRGGPLARAPAGWGTDAEFFTDDRKPVSGYLFASYAGDEAGGWSVNVYPLVTVRPSTAVSLSLGSGYYAGRDAAQYVSRATDTTATPTLGARYVFAELLQRSLDMSVRVNATFSPVLSFQLFAQPFTFAGNYEGFKELRARETFSFNTYGRDNGSTISRMGSEYTVDPDGPSPASPFTFEDPDFRTRSLRVNAVLRWEYRPGSTIFIVWTQSRSGYFPFEASFDLDRDLRRELFRDRPTNVLLVKLNYWMSL